MKLVVDVLECNSGVSKAGRAYNVALVRYDGRVGKVFSDVPLKVGDGQDVDLSLAPNQEMFLAPRIKSVE
jgi:hypothetical protein